MGVKVEFKLRVKFTSDYWVNNLLAIGEGAEVHITHNTNVYELREVDGKLITRVGKKEISKILENTIDID